jgi:FkbM family methyltransferase
MGLARTISHLLEHPLNRNRKTAALFNYVKWQLGSRLMPRKVLFDWVEGTKLSVQPGDHGLVGNVCCGLVEFEDMSYVLHLVKPEDLFIDVGANAGTFTILACKARGASGICFEPVPSTFARLEENLQVNGLSDRVEAFNMGVADKDGHLAFSSDLNLVNHVLTDDEPKSDSIEVEVKSLDSVLEGRNPSILKIDVEGFEAAVINGADRVLSNPSLQSVIMELRGHGDHYGFDETAILRKMLDYGFATQTYEPFSRELNSLDGKISTLGNTLFTRNEDLIRERVKTAPRIQFGSISF